VFRSVASYPDSETYPGLLITRFDPGVRLARVKPAVLDVLERDGVVDELGERHIYGNVYEACADHIPQRPSS
jgi:hypothetical protein